MNWLRALLSKLIPSLRKAFDEPPKEETEAKKKAALNSAKDRIDARKE